MTKKKRFHPVVLDTKYYTLSILEDVRVKTEEEGDLKVSKISKKHGLNLILYGLIPEISEKILKALQVENKNEKLNSKLKKSKK